MSEPWSPDSWRRCEAAQQPEYPDPQALSQVLDQVAQLPPLVTSWEIERLKGLLAGAARGEQFLLQGGDCCERFDDCTSDAIVSKLKVLLQMALILIHGGGRQVIRLGRFAGQYAKPRSSPCEDRDGLVLPAYRGDLINGPEFTPRERIPDPQRLLTGYDKAALTLNFIRALGSGGFADLHRPHQWDLAFASHSHLADEYHGTVSQILRSIQFVEAIIGGPIAELNQAEFYASHEALLLCYEQAQTRRVPRRSGWYNVGTHLPWIGERTRALTGAHVEYFRGLANPIGVKVGPSCGAEELVDLVERLDPHGEPGRLMLVHRLGAGRIGAALPPLVEAMARRGRQVLWCCDPMHGNTEVTDNGFKTRRFDRILHELDQAFTIHRELGSRLGGVHLELTGDDVTECLGGARGLASGDLTRAYRSQVDPRLNYEQALETALLIAERIGR